MLSDTMLDASESIKDDLQRHPEMYLPWHRQEAEKLVNQLYALGVEVGSPPDRWREENPKGQATQHHVIIDGYELSPQQANVVVEAIEDVMNVAHDDLMSHDVDENEKVFLAPKVLSLAEVLRITHPHVGFVHVEVNDDGKASFSGELDEYNGITHDTLATLAERG